MARIMTCDICGEEMDQNGNLADFAMNVPEQASTLRINMSNNGRDLLFEICPHCTQRVMDFIKNLTNEQRFGDENSSHGESK